MNATNSQRASSQWPQRLDGRRAGARGAIRSLSILTPARNVNDPRRRRHSAYPTTDIPSSSLPALDASVRSRVRERVLGPAAAWCAAAGSFD